MHPAIIPAKCPKCASGAIVKGSLDGDVDWGVTFRPETFKNWHALLTRRDGVLVSVESFACHDCGMVWSSVEPEALREFLGRHCK